MASERSNAGVASAAPKATDTPPKETLEFANLELAIEPPNMALVIPDALTFKEPPLNSIDEPSTSEVFI